MAHNEAWAGDTTYLRTTEGWMYLSIVMDSYSRRTRDWHIDKRMTVDLINQAMIKALNFRQPKAGLVFHSDKFRRYCIYLELFKSRWLNFFS
jgi:putative transposase